MRGVRAGVDVGLAGRLARSPTALLVLLLVVAAGALLPAYLALVSVNRESVDDVAMTMARTSGEGFARSVVEPQLHDGRLKPQGRAVVLRALGTSPGIAGGVLRDRRGRTLAARPAPSTADVLALTIPVDDARLELQFEYGPVRAAAADDERAMRMILALAAIAVYAALFPVLRTSAQALARAHADHHPALQRDLRDAMKRGELVLHFQPKLDLQTGEIPSAEALLRWQSVRRGTVPPGEFLPQVEETALMDDLTMHVIELAAGQLGEWHRAGFEITVAINLSPRTLATADLPQRIADCLDLYRLPPSQMILELTETAIMERPESDRQALEALVAFGFRISIDDFGTGRSSLERLDRLPVDELKIDRAFIARMEETEDATLVTAMIHLGHELGMRVVAEGVESHRTVEKLRELGCDLVQGYAVSRPVPDADLRRWLGDRRERADRIARSGHA